MLKRKHDTLTYNSSTIAIVSEIYPFILTAQFISFIKQSLNVFGYPEIYNYSEAFKNIVTFSGRMIMKNLMLSFDHVHYIKLTL